MNSGWTIEATELGRVLIPPSLPPATGLFYTTVDFPGRLEAGDVALVHSAMHQRFGIDARLVTCRQTHGTNAVSVESLLSEWKECDDCDALYSSVTRVSLGIKIADCLPVTLIDSAGGVLVNIHSGWRGAVADIVTKALQKVGEAFQPAVAVAYLGPSIRACCFEVGNEVIEQFAAVHGDLTGLVDDRRGPRPFLDIPGITRRRLETLGVPPKSIFDSGVCTRCPESIFHSHRRDGQRAGRNLAVVAR